MITRYKVFGHSVWLHRDRHVLELRLGGDETPESFFFMEVENYPDEDNMYSVVRATFMHKFDVTAERTATWWRFYAGTLRKKVAA